MAQQGQVFRLAGQGRDGTRWAYRYRVGGRGSKRVQRGGFESEQAAAEALERRFRPQGPGRLCPPHLQKRPHQDAEDEGERARGSPASDRARSPRRATAA